MKYVVNSIRIHLEDVAEIRNRAACSDRPAVTAFRSEVVLHELVAGSDSLFVDLDE